MVPNVWLPERLGEPLSSLPNTSAPVEAVSLSVGPDRSDNLQVVETARAKLRENPRDPRLLNELGIALMAFAQGEPRLPGLYSLEEAQRRFQQAAEQARRQGVPHSTYWRFEVNRALALSIIGEHYDDPATIHDALDILRPLVDELSADQTKLAAIHLDAARALNIYGNALMALHEYADAADAYEKALSRLTQERQPLSWARNQHYHSGALFQLARSHRQTPVIAQQCFARAISGYRAALRGYQDAHHATDATAATVSLANALTAFGALQLTSSDLDERREGVGHLQEAISYHLAALPASPPERRDQALGYLKTAVNLLKAVLGQYEGAANDNIRHGIINGEAELTKYSLSDDKQYIVSEDNTSISSIFDLLHGLGIPQPEWPRLLRSAADQSEAAATLPDEVVRRRPTADTGTAHILGSPTIGEEASAGSSMPPEAQEFFGNVPSVLRTKVYTKTAFPSDWFSNSDIVRAARRIVYAYKNRSKDIEIGPDEMERVRAANRFMRAYERRRERARTQADPPRGPR